MRLSHILLILVTAFSFSHQATAIEKTRNLGGPVVHDEYTWPTIGHWKVNDKSCTTICEFVVKPYTPYAALMTIIEDGKARRPVSLRYYRDYIWMTDNVVVDYPEVGKKKTLYVEYENGKLYDEYGRVWEKVGN